MTNTKNTRIFYVVGAIIIGIALWFTFFSRVAPPDFAEHPAGSERKAAFFAYFKPIIDEVNREIMTDHNKISEVCQSDSEANTQLSDLAKKYRVDKTDIEAESTCTVLLRRADTVPASLALAQAANESAWGTSRFAQTGNNFFGQWCFEEGCGIVPNSRDAGKAHEVAEFKSPTESVRSYMLNLNGHDAYKPLRQIRHSLKVKNAQVTGIELSYGLNKYSERGEEYGEELRQMIRFNKLTQYDSAS